MSRQKSKSHFMYSFNWRQTEEGRMEQTHRSNVSPVTCAVLSYCEPGKFDLLLQLWTDVFKIDFQGPFPSSTKFLFIVVNVFLNYWVIRVVNIYVCPDILFLRRDDTRSICITFTKIVLFKFCYCSVPPHRFLLATKMTAFTHQPTWTWDGGSFFKIMSALLETSHPKHYM